MLGVLALRSVLQDEEALAGFVAPDWLQSPHIMLTSGLVVKLEVDQDV